MTKPALFHALVPDPYASFRGGVKMTVVEVTTEKPKHWWGRNPATQMATHGRVDQIVSRFNNREDADTAARLYEEAWAMATPAVSAAELALNKARDDRQEAAMAAIANLVRSL